MRRVLFAGCAFAAVACAFSPRMAHAQAYSRLAPRQPAPAPAPNDLTLPGKEAPPLPQSNAVVIPALKGLVFIPDTTALKAAGLPSGTKGVQHAGLPLLDQAAFGHEMAAYLGKPLRMTDLNTIAAKVGTLYKAEGHPFVYVSIPPQNIGGGVVQIIVTEYRLGAVKTAGNHWFSDKLLRQESGLVPGQTLSLSDVQAGLGWLNSNPFRTVDALFAPGTAQGTTDVTLQTKDRLPLHVYGSYDNAGVPSLGSSEWAVGGTWGNVAGLGQILSYQFTHSVSDRYSGHALSWTAPLPWHDRIQVFGSYAWEKPDMRSSGAYLGETGHSGQASLRYIHDLPAITFGPHTRMTEDVQIGFDFKTTNNTLEFGGLRVFDSLAEVDQFPIIYNAMLNDPYGQTTFQNQLVLSPGGMSGSNRRRNFEALVPGSNDQYVYDTLSLSRTTWLPAGLSWILQATGQLASTNLMYNNQLGLGGLYTARGYFTDTALGSEGVSVTNEIRSPAFSLSKFIAPGLPVHDTEQVGLFYDYGHVSQVNPIAQSVNEADLSSIGLDLHSAVDRYVSLIFNVGWRLHGVSAIREQNGFGNKGGFGTLSLTVGY
ncbi:MAG: ShlB/FhaC/HecB family hemolysin secretion/activation protein [Acetobacter papayae]|uniref:ShlB/FhaC/HecB family hemolysin secretion/activation protein n=1 Tax=Acetobacter papayae TaxID=1076592 RepID=UPI0039EB34B5